MGQKNYLIEGVSGTGKTTVAEELNRRGYHVIHGDRELAFKGDPKTGIAVKEPVHLSDWDKAVWQNEHQLWDISKVKSVIKDHSKPVSFFCGSSRNFDSFASLLDKVFILEVKDLDTLYGRIDERVARDPTDWGAKPEERELIGHLHGTKENPPKNSVVIDSTAPLGSVVDEILSYC